MFCFDALLGNTDRHAGNWGIIKDKGVWKFSPIFDNGASLFPRASFTDVDEDWVRERVYIWTNSKVMFNKERERASYYLVLKENPTLQDYLHLFTSDKLEVAFVFIDATCISDDLKHLYKTMLYYRYNCIVKQKPFIWEGVL